MILTIHDIHKARSMMTKSMDRFSANRLIVIGAGASGLMAAGRAAEMGADVLLLEKMEKPGKKILLSGKTRCNLTNIKPQSEFIAMYGSNGRFLHGAFDRFFRDDLLALLKRYGVDAKVERGGRIFPISDKASDVVAALRRYANEHGVKMETGSRVTGVDIGDGSVQCVRLENGKEYGRAVILATGGASWPSTGSTGDGFRMAEEAGHTIVDIRPALVPLIVKEVQLASSMQGVSLRNIRLTAFQCSADDIEVSRIPSVDVGRGVPNRKARYPIIESRMGEMMITHFGIGGPVTLLMSLAVVDALKKGPVSVSIDLKPALTRVQLHARLQRDFDQYGLRTYRRIVEGLLPEKMISPVVRLSGVASDKPANQVSALERERLAGILKSLRFNVKGSLPLSSAIVTAGGVSLKEIEPKTMASRIVKGLYLCGEVLDLDADTGGYNLQAAFSTGYIAGESAAAYLLSH